MDKKIILFKSGNNEYEIDFVLVGKEKQKTFERHKGNSLGIATWTAGYQSE